MLDPQYGRMVTYCGDVTNALRALALALAVGLGGAACGEPSTTDGVALSAAETSSGETDSSSDTADDATAPTAPSVADETTVAWDHNWTGDLIGGGQIDANSLVGQDVVLWFWAPW